MYKNIPTDLKSKPVARNDNIFFTNLCNITFVKKQNKYSEVFWKWWHQENSPHQQDYKDPCDSSVEKKGN